MDLIPKKELDKMFSYEWCEMDFSFLCFDKVYKGLASFIGKYYTVIDFGCYLAPQAWYFKDHDKYIGVDVISTSHRLELPNTEHFCMSIQDFIANKAHEFDLGNTFAICSYVPNKEAEKLVRETFTRLCIYYVGSKFRP